ncbi:MAG: rhodanese-like domain-containing protein [Candidatus Thiodiazotropha sp. (ex Myrtea sp. 'scaly one' KF741663)]|nr:rhodanese-like domain-containing protein [Candidatus Thiodiazotropha sp. (ex Myrtea sp. 'scaly one' KF741663)]
MRTQSVTNIKTSILSSLICTIGLGYNVQAFSAEGDSDGNRYYLQRYYTEDISAARAYLGMLGKHQDDEREDHDEHGKKDDDEFEKLTIIDVRDATEYLLGHPKKAIHMPYPRIYRECVDDLRTEDGACSTGTVYQVRQDPEDLFLQIEDKIPKKNTPIATLCRTGFRSVLAANILSQPTTICDLKGYVGADHDQCVTTYTGRGYSNVANIWQGFVGQPMAGIVSSGGKHYVVGDDQILTDLILNDGSAAKGFIAFDLDLNNDEAIGADDKDGWRYHQGLPFDTKMSRKRINQVADDLGYYDLP